MGSFSDYLENALLNHAFKGTALTQPTHLYVMLCKSTILDASTGTTAPGQVSGGAYARVQCDSWDAASGGATANTNVVTFPQATSNWGTITDFAIVDNATGGNIYAYGKLTTPKNVQTGDTLKFATGDIDIQLS